MGPIIVIGMHRSGTSLLSRILERLGVFMGHEKDENHEAVFFQSINVWIFQQLNATWDNVYNFRFLQTTPEVGTLLAERVKGYLSAPQISQYLGPELSKTYKNLWELDLPWGWKDPRNTFTLAIWRSLFPQSKVLHICRHPLDVALSLREREGRLVIERLLSGAVGKTAPIQPSIRCLDLREGIKLWEDYVGEACGAISSLSRNGYQLRFEDLLLRPKETMRELCRFLGIRGSEDVLEGLRAEIDPRMAYRFRSRADALQLTSLIEGSELARRLNYLDLPSGPQGARAPGFDRNRPTPRDFRDEVLEELRARLRQREEELEYIYGLEGWKLLKRCYRIADGLLPPGTRRRRMAEGLLRRLNRRWPVE